MAPSLSDSILIPLILYLLASVTKSQYTEIWYDNMDTNNAGWSIHNDVAFPYSSSGCWSDPSGGECASCTADNGDSYLQRSSDVSAYSSIQLQLDIWGYELEASDECQVIYCYASSNSCLNSAGTATTIHYNYNGSDGAQGITENLGTPTHNRLWLRLSIHGNAVNGGDKCYFDTVYLRGIPTPSPTPSPTALPTVLPTYNPTKSPTLLPTVTPTYIPTKLPTLFPTVTPTYNPTATILTIALPNPTRNPTITPTQNPTLYTNMPTLSPTKRPISTNIPTGVPSELPTIVGTENSVTNSGEKVRTTSLGNYTNLMVLIAGGFSIICCLLCIICILLKYSKKRKRNYKLKNDNENVSMQKLSRVMSTSSTVKTNGEAQADNIVKLVEWLSNLNLMEYYDTFVENGFSDGRELIIALSQTTNDDLKEMGVKLAHRKLILNQIKTDQKERERDAKKESKPNMAMNFIDFKMPEPVQLVGSIDPDKEGELHGTVGVFDSDDSNDSNNVVYLSNAGTTSNGAYVSSQKGNIDNHTDDSDDMY